MTKKWLIISYFSGVDGLACSHHIDDRIDALQDSSVEPVVVSSLCAEKSVKYKKYRIPSIAPSGLKFELRYITRRNIANKTLMRLVQLPFLLILLPFYFVESIVCNLGSSWSWFVTAGLSSVSIAKKHKCEVVYSTGGSPCAHIAGYMCSKLTGLRWIAELQDPIVGSWMRHSKIEKKFNSYIERIISENADAVVFMTQGSLDYFETRHELSGRGHVIYPGAKSDLYCNSNEKGNICDHSESVEERKIVFGHFGSLSGDRNTKCLTQAIEDIFNNDSSIIKSLKLIFIGNYDSNQSQLFDRLKSFVSVDVRGKMTRKEALNAQNECDVLLMIQNTSEESSYSIPSKTYEYLNSEIPVFALTYKNKELEDIVRGLGHYCADQTNVNDVKKELLKLINDWKCGNLTGSINSSPYTTKNAAEQLLNVV